jgi:hypothetical protein
VFPRGPGSPARAIRVGAFGAKFEELLIVEPDRAYWLDDSSQQRLTIQA